MEILGADARRFFLFGMRFFFGAWLLYAGITKWLPPAGPAGFVGTITGMFDPTWSPHALNVALAWIILVAEPVVAGWILLGSRARLAWSAASLLMFMLLMGQTLLMSPNTVHNWHFVILTLVCAALAGPDRPGQPV